MADAVYDDARDNILGNGVHGQTDWDTDNMRIGLRDEATTAINLTTHIDLADVSSAHVDTTANLTTAVGTAALGAWDFSDETIVTVSGAVCASFDVYEETGIAGTSPLLLNIDAWTGLPITPNGGDVTFAPAAGGAFQILGA